MSLSSKQEQEYHQRDSSFNFEQDKQVQSQYTEAYAKIIKPKQFNLSTFVQKFNHHGISYHQNASYEPFSFQVERVISSFDYFKIHVKIGKFSLTVNTLRYLSENIFKDLQSTSGTYGNIYFVSFKQKSLCFKSLPFDEEDSFYDLFPKVVKEWSILKICSALQCAPIIQNNFGFDIIIFNNCIQYGTEKGEEQLNTISAQCKNILKEMLWLMHQFNIVHSDIKPQNIVMSPQLGHPVFIDFGLSEIIKQKLGFKTFCDFRGTPNFCSHQMLKLIGGNYDNVDLYFNDAVGLDATINSFYFEIEKEQQVNVTYKRQQNQHLLLISFQFHYVEGNQIEAVEQLKRYKRQGGNIKAILLFMKKVSGCIFLPSILYQHLKQFKSYVQWKDVQEKLKRFSNQYFYKKQFLEQTPQANIEYENNDKISDVEPLSYNSTKRGYFLPTRGYPKYAKLILNTANVSQQNIAQLMSIAFMCIRFDQKNLPFQEKVLIATKMSNLICELRGKNVEQIQFKAYQSTQQSPDLLAQVRAFIALMIEECLAGVLSKDSKEILFDLIQQAILVDLDLLPFIDRLLQTLLVNFIATFDMYLAMVECSRLSESIKMILTDHLESSQIVKSRLNRYIETSLSKLKERIYQPDDKETINIRDIIFALKRNIQYQNRQVFDECMEKLKQIKHIKLKKYLLYLIMCGKALDQFYFSNNAEIWSMISFAKQSLDSFKLDFFSSLRITIKLVKLTQSLNDMDAYSSYIGTIINCGDILKKINFITWRESKFPIRTAFLQDITKFVKAYSQISHLSQQSDQGVFDILTEIVRNQIPIDQQLHDQLILLYRAYSITNKNRKEVQYNKIVQCFYAYNRKEIQLFFYQFDEETKGVFMQNLRTTEIMIQAAKKESLQHQHKMQYLQYKKLLYQYQLHIHEQNYQEAMQCLHRLIVCCYFLQIDSLVLEFFKIFNFICYKLGNEDMIIVAALRSFQLCHKLRYLSFYLLPTSMHFTFTLFAVLARVSPTTLQSLLIGFIDFLYEHPVESYIRTLLSSLELFLKRDPTFGHVIHYSRFNIKSISFPYNPYLLLLYVYSLNDQSPLIQLMLLKAIAMNIDRLNDFAKHYILQKYFVVILSLFENKQLPQRIYTFRNAKRYLAEHKRQRQARNVYRQVSKRDLYPFKKLIRIRIKKIINSFTMGETE